MSGCFGLPARLARAGGEGAPGCLGGAGSDAAHPSREGHADAFLAQLRACEEALGLRDGEAGGACAPQLGWSYEDLASNSGASSAAPSAAPSAVSSSAGSTPSAVRTAAPRGSAVSALWASGSPLGAALGGGGGALSPGAAFWSPRPVRVPTARDAGGNTSKVQMVAEALWAALDYGDKARAAGVCAACAAARAATARKSPQRRAHAGTPRRAPPRPARAGAARHRGVGRAAELPGQH